jgi:hypothetical protein
MPPQSEGTLWLTDGYQQHTQSHVGFPGACGGPEPIALPHGFDFRVADPFGAFFHQNVRFVGNILGSKAVIAISKLIWIIAVVCVALMLWSLLFVT